jgi:hypothetical protein
MTIIYGRKWSLQYKAFNEGWPEARARNAHLEGKEFAALVIDDCRPFCCVEFCPGSFAVNFLDDLLRDYFLYSFIQKKPNQLFIGQATSRVYVGKTDKVKSGITWLYTQEGLLTVRRTDGITKKTEIKESQVEGGLENHWETWPEFGQYERIIKKERNLYMPNWDDVKIR